MSIRPPVNMRILCLATTLIASVAGVHQRAAGDIVWTETYVADGTTFGGTDVEGLANATFVLNFTTDSGVYVNGSNGSLAATATTGTLTISGATVGANNGTFILGNDPSWNMTGSLEAYVNAGGVSAVLDQGGVKPGIFLPSGSLLRFPTAIFNNSAVAPLWGDTVDSADFNLTFASALEFGPEVIDTTPGATAGDVIWRQAFNEMSSSVSVTSASAVPEPSSIALLAMSTVGLAVRRRRRRQS